MSLQRRAWFWAGMLTLVVFWGSACTGGIDLRPASHGIGATEVDLNTHRMDDTAGYKAPRHASRYHHDATEVDLATAKNIKTPNGTDQPDKSIASPRASKP